MSESPTLSEKRRAASLARKKFGAGAGRPLSRKKRCPCGANTAKRAKARAFECCKKAGMWPPLDGPR